jgi:hypothetical protein
MLVDLWIEEMNDAIPRATLFVHKGNSVIVYGLETGTAWVLISTRDAGDLTQSVERAVIHRQRPRNFQEI